MRQETADEEKKKVEADKKYEEKLNKNEEEDRGYLKKWGDLNRDIAEAKGKRDWVELPRHLTSPGGGAAEEMFGPRTVTEADMPQQKAAFQTADQTKRIAELMAELVELQRAQQQRYGINEPTFAIRQIDGGG